ncbi:MAG: glycosyltransferase family 2 protein [Ferruginibacter sp.]
MNNNGISVVIPNYNGRYLLDEIIPSLMTALQNCGLPHEIFIVDDFSTDDSVQHIKNQYPFIKLLQNENNRGFSPTINKGIFAAQYDYILLLNSDVKLSQEYFKTLLPYFERADTFGVMGRIIGWDDDKIQDGAKYPSFHGAKIKTTGNYVLQEPGKNDWLYTMYLSGANALVSRQKILELKGFNEIFAPFYVEDYELSLRAWRLGWKCYYDHHAVCRHKESVSIKTKSKKDFINTIYYRNKMFLHAIHLDGVKLFAWYLQLIPEAIIRLFTLRFYYFKSLQLFAQDLHKVKKAKDDLQLLAGKRQLLSVKKLADIILQSIAGKEIIRF